MTKRTVVPKFAVDPRAIKSNVKKKIKMGRAGGYG
jgi:hypothetical protein